MKKLIIAFGVLVCGVALAVGEDEPRVFTSTDGTEVVGTIVSVIGETVQLKRTDGKTFNVPINRFSATDGEYIKRWKEENKGRVPAHLQNKKPRLRLAVSSGKTNKEDDQISGYVDERKQKMGFKITIENEDPVYPIPEATVTLLVMGEGERRERAVVYQKVFEGVALPKNEEKLLAADRFELWYDHEGSAQYGFKYKGYLLWVTAPDGKILGEAVIPSTASRYLDAIQKLNEGDVVDNRFVKTGSASLSNTVKNKGG